jgi:dTDP-4-amino-4,6-dideoxygalactose transaminase
LRRKNAKLYDKMLNDAGVVLPAERQGSKHVYYLYVVRSAQRDGLQRWLKSKGVETMIHYPIPIHLQDAYKELGHRRGDFPAAEKCADEVLSLPMFPELKKRQIEKIAACVKSFKN